MLAPKKRVIKNLEDSKKHCVAALLALTGQTTKAIRNLGNVLILKLIALNEISGKLGINRFKIPIYA